MGTDCEKLSQWNFTPKNTVAAGVVPTTMVANTNKGASNPAASNLPNQTINS